MDEVNKKKEDEKNNSGDDKSTKEPTYWYQQPEVVPGPLPILSRPERNKNNVAAEEIAPNIFIKDPKSLPTDLSKFQRPRGYYEQLKADPELVAPPYEEPKLIGSKPKLGLTVRKKKLYSDKPTPDGIGRHVMQIRNADDIKDLEAPLKLIRKEVRLYAEKTKEELAEIAKNEAKNLGTGGGANAKGGASQGGTGYNKQNMFKKKTIQIFEHDKEAREIKLREALPWVVADANGIEHLKGKHDEEEDIRYIALIKGKNGRTYIKKVDRIYNFTYRPPTSELTLEQKENLIRVRNKTKKGGSLKSKIGDALKSMLKKDKESDVTASAFGGYNPLKLKTVHGAQNYSDFNNGRGEDMEEVDYDEDFQDDDEGVAADDIDEDTKAFEDRVKKSQQRLNPAGYFDDDMFGEDKDEGSKSENNKEDEEEDSENVAEEIEEQIIEEQMADLSNNNANDSDSSFNESDIEKMDTAVENKRDAQKALANGSPVSKSGLKKREASKLKLESRKGSKGKKAESSSKPASTNQSGLKRGTKNTSQAIQNVLQRQKLDEKRARDLQTDPIARARAAANQPLRPSPLSQTTTLNPSSQSKRPADGALDANKQPRQKVSQSPNSQNSESRNRATVSNAGTDLQSLFQPKNVVKIVEENPGITPVQVYEKFKKKHNLEEASEEDLAILRKFISKVITRDPGTNKAVVKEKFRSLR
ncbi:hypothetical protein K502DRAFT_366169 [Neoconidiobolus thromboides FSU 785]|nr:hypothetical protein K502DRAFT_366169 [Neoconidiobolus thromboides FSU 785]